MKASIVVLLLFTISPLISQEPVKEEMSVDWWVVPLFAVDKSGNPVKDLDKNDVKLYLDDKLVDDFTLYSREYNAGQALPDSPLLEVCNRIQHIA